MSSYHSVLKNAQARMEEAGYGEQSALLYMLELTNKEAHNLYMEYEDKHCLDDVLQLYRSCNIKVLNIQITRSAENGEHNACAIFTLRLPRSCGVEKLLTLVGRCEGIVSVEEL